MKKIFSLLILSLCFFSNYAQEISNKDAMALISKAQKNIGLADSDLKNSLISSAYFNTTSNTELVYLQQGVFGVPILNRIKTLAFKDGNLVTNAGEFISEIEKKINPQNGQPLLSNTDAINLAFKETGIINSKSLTLLSTDEKNIQNFGKINAVWEDITTQLNWIESETNPNEVILTWQVQIFPKSNSNTWWIYVNALTGKIEKKINLTISEHADDHNDEYYREKEHEAYLNNYAQFEKTEISAALPPTVTSANYNVVPYPYESPDHYPFTLKNNPWLNAGAGNLATTNGWHFDGTNNNNYTRGNNVYTYLDIANNNNPGTTNIPATSTSVIPNLNFNFAFDSNTDPNTTTNRQNIITNLFYWNNINHDILYQYGFTEAAGNFQIDNLGRGGNPNDYVLAEAQDGGGMNNANMTTPADGSKPRMQMYLWDAVSKVTFRVNSPSAIAGLYDAVESGFSTANKLSAVGPITGNLVYVDDATGGLHEACNTFSNTLTGKIALIDRGNCSFIIKVKNAQNAGAIAVIMINNAPGNPIIMGGTDNTITIPAIMISQDDGNTIKTQLAQNINVTLSAIVGQRKDGDLDNGIITHEYNHGTSNRLTGGPAASTCLSNAEQGGEGWSDYYALMFTTNWATANVTDGSKARPMGTYVFDQNPNTGAGIRNYRYSTDMTINPLTYADLGTGVIGTEVHNIGEVWCMAIWEMTWGIIQQKGISPDLYNANATGGNIVALKLVTEGMKQQKCRPGFLDARDGILKADSLLYNGANGCTIWTAFAKRGMGWSALQGLSTSATDQTAAYDLPPNATLTAQPQNQTSCPETTVTFSVTRTNIKVSYVYVWQVSTDNGVTWNDITLNTDAVASVNNYTATLTLNNITESMNNYKYRAVVFGGCTPSDRTNSNAATLTVYNAAQNAYLAPSTVTTLVKTCDENGWTYYKANGDATNKYVIGIKWNGNAAAKTAATPTITVDANYFQVTNTAIPAGTFVMKRYWNVNGVTTLTNPVSLRFFYDPAEKVAVENAATNFSIANGNANIEPPTWFKTVGTNYANDLAHVNENKVLNAIPLTDDNTSGLKLNNVLYAEFNNITSFSGGSYATGVGLFTPLPVTLSVFNAIEKNCEITLSWKSDVEANLNSYKIEKSTDGINFSELSTVYAQGSDKNYMFVDHQSSTGNNFYRLRMIDNNGAEKLGPIVKAIVNCNGPKISIAPTITKNITKVKGLSGKEIIYVYDASSKLVLTQKASGNETTVNLSKYSSGLYLVKVVSDSETIFTGKIIKQ